MISHECPQCGSPMVRVSADSPYERVDCRGTKVRIENSFWRCWECRITSRISETISEPKEKTGGTVRPITKEDLAAVTPGKPSDPPDLPPKREK